MKKILSAIVVAGALAQAASAMGPLGDRTHRHLYKDQEWIWQQEQTQPKSEAGKDTNAKFSWVEIWSPLAFGMPNRPPYLAFGMPNRPPYLAFGMPNRPPYLAFGMPNRPPHLAFGMPNRPPYMAFGMPNRPPLIAFGMPNRPPSTEQL